LDPRLILIDQNGVTASFFLMLANATGQAKYRDAAISAFSAFSGDFASYGIQAAPLVKRWDEWLRTRRIGMMECWSHGVWGMKEPNLSNIPSLQYSNPFTP
jgi:uncharacterized protein YyaL (SSP411 family)